MFHFRTWLRRISGKLFRHHGASRPRPRRSSPPRLAEKVLLRLEQLETRLLPATYLVNSTADSGAGTLRDAINQVNSGTDNSNVIDFNISTGDSGYHSSTGSWTITPTSALPTITNSVTIDATSQPGWSRAPVIELSGASAGSSVNGLTVGTGGGGSTIKGLDIASFQGSGIELDAAATWSSGTTSAPTPPAPPPWQRR